MEYIDSARRLVAYLREQEYSLTRIPTDIRRMIADTLEGLVQEIEPDGDTEERRG